MKNKSLLTDYKSEVLDLFKIHYKKICAKDLSLNFKSVLQMTLSELGITAFQEQDVSYLESWFNMVHFQLFISEIIEMGAFNELIFHSNSEAQKLSLHGKEIVNIDHLNTDDYQLSFEVFALKNNIAWNFSEPFASFQAKINKQDFRITLIHHSSSANKKSKMFLRAIQSQNPSLSQFTNDQKMQQLISDLVKTKKNILISGSTGSGKTTFLRALLNETIAEEHIIILEDTHEIIPFSPFQTSLLAKADVQKKSLKDYCSYALRMSPDRIIIGEMRSGEVVPFMLAMNTGHKGLMSTIHANSGVDALSRVALLFSLYSENKELDFALITKLTCKNIDYIIHLENKTITEICRVVGSEGSTPFYEMIYDSN